MQNFTGSAELGALGVCPCTILLVQQNSRHWVRAHAKFYWFRRTGSIACVPKQNFVGLAELKAVGVCPCRNFFVWRS